MTTIATIPTTPPGMVVASIMLVCMAAPVRAGVGAGGFRDGGEGGESGYLGGGDDAQ